MDSKEIVKALIQSYLGKPYVWGGDDPVRGFDCSGMCLELMQSIGIWALGDTTAQGLHNAFKKTPADIPIFGDFAFYGDSHDKISHVAFCLNSKLIFEFGGGGSKTRTEQDAINQNAYGRIRPIDKRRDKVAVLRPPWPWDVGRINANT